MRLLLLMSAVLRLHLLLLVLTVLVLLRSILVIKMLLHLGLTVHRLLLLRLTVLLLLILLLPRKLGGLLPSCWWLTRIQLITAELVLLQQWWCWRQHWVSHWLLWGLHARNEVRGGRCVLSCSHLLVVHVLL